MSRTQDLIRLLGNTAKDNAGATSLTPIISSAVTNVVDNNFISNLIPVETTSYATANQLPASNNSIGDQAFVSETNRLYIWNGNGWYNIALINTNPTFSVSPQSNYVLSVNDSGYIPSLSVTILATDPEGIPITYSALLSDSASNFITVTQDSGVFTFIPKSVDSISEYDSDGGVFSVTFRASDGVNLALALSEFTIEISNLIENSRYTTLLLKTNSVNSAQNNTFLDSSTNNFTITRSGNVTQGTFSPYGNRWSGYFDGTGDYLSIGQNSAFNFTGDFTFECWFNPSVLSGARALFGNYTAATSADWYVRIAGSDLNVYLDGGSLRLSVTLPSANIWYHVAIVRSGSTITGYLNGSSFGTWASSNTIGSSSKTIYIGSQGAGSEPFNGYISSLRFVNGTALYTSNFTPPTEPLTAVSGTSLLTLQDNRFIDRSTNNFTLIPAGDVKISRFSPYDQSRYNPLVDGGSGYFDGDVDYLQTSSSSVFAFGTNDFTMEAWIYPTNVSGIQGVVSTRIDGTAATNQVFFGIDGTNVLYYAGSVISSSGGIVKNAWQHIACSRSGSTVRLFLNGNQVASGNDSESKTTTFGFIGSGNGGSGQLFIGYISNARIISGTSLYNTNFTLPEEQLTAVANTSLLLKFTNAGIYDGSTKNVIETRGNAQTNTAVTKFNSNGSLYFDGAGDGLIVPSSVDFDFGTRDFTIEMWLRLLDVSSGWIQIIGRAYGITGGWVLYKKPSVSALAWWHNSSTVIETSNLGLSNNTWYHIAVVRFNGTIRIYVNGNSQISGSDSFNYNPGVHPLGIGFQAADAAYPLNGYIEDLRITKGLARYTANFTPPTAPLSG